MPSKWFQQPAGMLGLLALLGVVAWSHGLWMSEKKDYYRHAELISAIKANTAAIKEMGCHCADK